MAKALIRYRSDRPILIPDKPWEEGASLRAVSVIPENEGQRLRMYYLTWHRGAFEKNVLCVAYSTDGFIWEKPDLGEGHNIVFRGCGEPLDWGSFFPQQIIYEKNEEDESVRWKMVLWDRPEKSSRPGLCLAGSKDGYEWNRLYEYPVMTNQNDGSCLIAANDNNPILWMDCKYYIYQQTWKYNASLPLGRDNKTKMHRRISVWATEGFKENWVGPIVVLEPDSDDPPDDQFYWLTVFPTDSGYGGLLSVHHTTNQHMNMQLVSSKDGWDWKRECDRQPVLGPGGPGRFDSGSTSALCGPMRIGEKVILYYLGQSWVHDQSNPYPDVEIRRVDYFTRGCLNQAKNRLAQSGFAAAALANET